jgi:hypothetical protein
LYQETPFKIINEQEVVSWYTSIISCGVDVLQNALPGTLLLGRRLEDIPMLRTAEKSPSICKPTSLTACQAHCQSRLLVDLLSSYLPLLSLTKEQQVIWLPSDADHYQDRHGSPSLAPSHAPEPMLQQEKEAISVGLPPCKGLNDQVER